MGLFHFAQFGSNIRIGFKFNNQISGFRFILWSPVIWAGNRQQQRREWLRLTALKAGKTL